jgi:PhzF family phenazine biosynthesis protein
MKIPLFIVDAFTDTLFSGNPAAVCPLEEWPDDGILQSIAIENNLSETAFFLKEEKTYDLRWFTPAVEVDLCGHATLASAHVLFHHLGYDAPQINFQSRSGELVVKNEDEMLVMDFPAFEAAPIDTPDGLAKGLGLTPQQVLQAPNTYMAVYENEEDILSLSPDFNLIEALDMGCVIVTARGKEVDFVSRFFAPAFGIPEDPVTGSAHCTLVPYWSDRLGKKALRAVQLSARRGYLYCRDNGERVSIGGNAVTFSIGEITL